MATVSTRMLISKSDADASIVCSPTSLHRVAPLLRLRHLRLSTQSKDLRLGPTKTSSLAAPLAVVLILAAVTLAPAADTIEELLQQDEASGQNDMLRPDLNALTEAQWEYYFKVGQQSDTQLVSQLVEHESEKPTRAFYIWVMAIAVGFGMAIGAIVALPSVRRTMRTVMVPVQMEDLNVTIGAYAGYGDGRP
jgi:hypothetical protein